MFGSSKRHAFTPTAYGATRKKRRIPRWLLLIIAGIVLGAGGLLFLQKSYGPKRLTVEQSEQLHYDLNSANMDKQRLQSELNQQGRDLAQARSRLEALEKELQAGRDELEAVKEHVTLFADAMPPAPRGTSPGINAASFDYLDDSDTLQYNILVMQDKDQAGSTFNGVLQLAVTGRYPNGRTGTIELDPVDIAVDRYNHVEGAVVIPNSMVPRQVTIQIMDSTGKRQVATRIINVR